MTTEVRDCNRVELRTARPADLPEVLTLLGNARLPTAGVVEAFSDFVVAESEGGACPSTAVLMRKRLGQQAP